MSRMIWFGASAVFLAAGLGVFLSRAPKTDERSSEQRIIEAAEKEYQTKMKQLTDDLLAHKIDETAFARASANEKGFLDHRKTIAINPVSDICQSEMRLVSNHIREYPLPKVCPSGDTFP